MLITAWTAIRIPNKQFSRNQARFSLWTEFKAMKTGVQSLFIRDVRLLKSSCFLLEMGFEQTFTASWSRMLLISTFSSTMALLRILITLGGKCYLKSKQLVISFFNENPIPPEFTCLTFLNTVKWPSECRFGECVALWPFGSMTSQEALDLS